MDSFLGMIIPTGASYAFTGWALCAGQVIPINQNDALYALVGSQFTASDSYTNFNLPDLQGMTMIGTGVSAGGPAQGMTVYQGQTQGAASTNLTYANLPPHEPPVSLGGMGAAQSTSGSAVQGLSSSSAGTTQSGIAGGGLPFNNMQPSLGMTFQIALEGIFPSRYY